MYIIYCIIIISEYTSLVQLRLRMTGLDPTLQTSYEHVFYFLFHFYVLIPYRMDRGDRDTQ
jgi:hypothetical protein